MRIILILIASYVARYLLGLRLGTALATPSCTHAMPAEAIRANYKILFSWPFPLPKLRLNVSSGLLSAEPVGLKD